MSENKLELSVELVIEILARLPVKSLIKFTCVCKFWLSLIKSSEFATKHYATRTDLLSKHTGNEHKCHFFLSYSINPGKIVVVSYETLENPSIFHCKPVDLPLSPKYPSADYRWIFLGPCNGIFCLCFYGGYTRDVYLLWNPSTREVFEMAKCKYKIRAECTYMGFGFDGETNDYKLKVVAFEIDGIFGGGGPLRLRLYSLATDSWRNIDDPGYHLDKGSLVLKASTSTSNGRMCSWLGVRNIDHEKQKEGFLLSFDVVNETFVETPGRHEFVFHSNHRCVFMQQRSHLMYPALLCCDTGDWANEGYSRYQRVTSVDIWVLNGYGPTGYWTKQVSVTMLDNVNVFWPKGIRENNEIVFVNDFSGFLGLYDDNTHKAYYTQVPISWHVMGFIESLLSIKSFSRHESDLNLMVDDDSQETRVSVPYCLREANQQSVPTSASFGLYLQEFDNARWHRIR